MLLLLFAKVDIAIATEEKFDFWCFKCVLLAKWYVKMIKLNENSVFLIYFDKLGTVLRRNSNFFEN